jgi:hypothetical protein
VKEMRGDLKVEWKADNLKLKILTMRFVKLSETPNEFIQAVARFESDQVCLTLSFS